MIFIWLGVFFQALNIDISDTIAIGNDYNDLELLKVAGKSYVVENAPETIKSLYKVVSSNENDGFSEAIRLSLYNLER